MERDRKTKAGTRPAKLKAGEKIRRSAAKSNAKYTEKKRNQTTARAKTTKGQLPIIKKVSRRAQEELIGTRQRLLAIYEHAPIGIAECSPEGKYVNCNEEFCRITGYSREELVGLWIKDLTHEEDYIFDIKLHQRLVAGEIPFYKMEKRIVRKDGQIIWVELTRNVVRDSEGRALFTIGVVLDVTERKKAEQGLQSARERAEHTADRIARLQKVTAALSEARTPSQVAEVVVDQGAPALGAVTGSMIVLAEDGQTLELVHTNSPESLTRPYQRFPISLSVPVAEAVRSGQPVWMESRQQYLERYPQLADQINLWGHQAAMAVPMLSQGRILGALTLSFDRILPFASEDRDYAMTLAQQCAQALERARAEEALRASEERFRVLVNQATAGISQTDMNGVVTIANPRLCEMLGYPESELVGKTIWELTYPEDLKENQRVFERMISHGESYQFEKRFICRDGSILWANISVSPLYDSAGNPKGGVGVVIDINERKRSEQALAGYAREQEALYDLTDQLHRTNSLEEIFNAALNAIFRALQCDRASILLFDDTNVMRFIAWRGLSDGYRKATEGHSPWKPDTKNPEPISIDDTRTADLTDSLKAVIEAEGIRSLAFIPLVSNGKLIGKFMVYFNAPHAFGEDELNLSLTIAHQLAFGIDRKRGEDALRASEALYRTIARSIPGGGVYVIDKDFRYVVAEGPVTEAFGLTREMLEGRTVSEVFPTEVGERMKDRLQRNFAGETVSFETKHNGRVYWTQQAPLLDPLGQAIVVTLDITERKQAEEALRQSEERFVQFMQNLPGLAWIKDLQGRYVYANAAAEKVFNTTREKLYGRTDHDIFPLEVANQFKSNDEQALKDGKGLQAVETLKHADGIPHYSLVSKFPIPGPDGNIALIGGTAFDITERKQAEEKIVFQANLLSAVGSAVIATDLNGAVLYWNPAAEKLYGWPASDALGKNILEVSPAPQSQERAQQIMEQLASGASWSGEFLVQRRDGRTFPAFVSDSPILDSNGKLVGIIGVSSDITDRKKAEEALRESEEWFRAIVDQATAGIVRHGVDGRLTFVNQTFCNMLGYTEAELVGQPVWQFTHQDDIQENKRLFDRLMSEGLPFKLEKRLVRKDGSILWVDVSASPIFDAAGRSYSTVAVEVDITDRKEAEQALQELNLQLENRVRSRTAELQIANQTLTEEINERKQAEEALRESREGLQVLSKRLVEVQEEERRAIARELHDRVGQTLAALNINLIIMNSQLLDDSKQRIGSRMSDSMQLTMEAISLVRNVMTDLRPAVLDDYGLQAALQSYTDDYKSRYGIQVILDPSDTIIPRLDPGLEMTVLRIAQEALTNVARHAQAEQVNVSLRLEDHLIYLTVQDDGVGMEAQQGTSRRDSQGLKIMRERAEAFGGSLHVGPATGKGTRVEARIPIQNRSQAREETRE